MCIMFVYTVVKVVSYYELRVLSISAIGFQLKSLVGAVLFWIFGTFYFAKPVSPRVVIVGWTSNN